MDKIEIELKNRKLFEAEYNNVAISPLFTNFLDINKKIEKMLRTSDMCDNNLDIHFVACNTFSRETTTFFKIKPSSSGKDIIRQIDVLCDMSIIDSFIKMNLFSVSKLSFDNYKRYLVKLTADSFFGDLDILRTMVIVQEYLSYSYPHELNKREHEIKAELYSEIQHIFIILHELYHALIEIEHFEYKEMRRIVLHYIETQMDSDIENAPDQYSNYRKETHDEGELVTECICDIWAAKTLFQLIGDSIQPKDLFSAIHLSFVNLEIISLVKGFANFYCHTFKTPFQLFVRGKLIKHLVESKYIKDYTGTQLYNVYNYETILSNILNTESYYSNIISRKEIIILLSDCIKKARFVVSSGIEKDIELFLRNILKNNR